jgi:hypothetical protein
MVTSETTLHGGVRTGLVADMFRMPLGSRQMHSRCLVEIGMWVCDTVSGHVPLELLEKPDPKLGSWVGFAAWANLEKPDPKLGSWWGLRHGRIWRSEIPAHCSSERTCAHQKFYMHMYAPWGSANGPKELVSAGEMPCASSAASCGGVAHHHHGLAARTRTRGRPKKKVGDPRGGWVGQSTKKDQGQIYFFDIFYRVFELPSSRNAQKRD